MKSTGMIRKIDDLGRIVIPKEIRNNLKIRENDSLEIYIEEDKMVLKKFNKLASYEEQANYIIKSFDKIFNLNIVVVDMTKVLFCSKNKKDSLLNKELSNDLINLISERKIIVNKEISKVNWFKNIELMTCKLVFPIIDNIELLGAVILISDKKVTDYEIAIVKLFSLLVKNK